MVEILDWNIGRLTDALGQLPRFAGESTLLVYISDHGDFMASHDLSVLHVWAFRIQQHPQHNQQMGVIDYRYETQACMVDCRPYRLNQVYGIDGSRSCTS
jgi:arylsulfatase A-like enzyme